MIARIEEELTKIERVHGVKVLYAVESGSRVWGFHSQDSDYDVRFIYQRPITWYLSVHERRDVIELALTDDNLDITGWDLKKALFQVAKGNPALSEWLWSPLVYRKHAALEQLRALATHYANHRTTIYHYLHMANGNYRTYLQQDEVRLKKYLYVLRPLLCCMWTERIGTACPVSWDLLETINDWDLATRDEVHNILALKRSGHELEQGPKVACINTWIEAKLDHFAKLARTTAKGPQRSDDLDEFFVQCLWSKI